MPAVRRGESKSEYISRAVKYMIENEGLSQDHALGKAYGMWEQYIKENKKLGIKNRRAWAKSRKGRK